MIVNIGGPVGGALVAMLATWAVRLARSIIRSRRSQLNEAAYDALLKPDAPMPAFLFTISPAALRILVNGHSTRRSPMRLECSSKVATCTMTQADIMLLSLQLSMVCLAGGNDPCALHNDRADADIGAPRQEQVNRANFARSSHNTAASHGGSLTWFPTRVLAAWGSGIVSLPAIT